MMRYPAVFEYDDEERVYNVHFPDIGGCVTFGDDLDEAKRMASEALTGVLLTLIEKGRDIPTPSALKGANIHMVEPERTVAFALWLRDQRKRSGMTQTEIADKLGVKYQVYQRLEDPERANPTLKTIERLERVFGQRLITV
jgi:antitoxin HicB